MPRRKSSSNRGRQRAISSRRELNARLVVTSHLPGSFVPRDDLTPQVSRLISPYRNISTQLFRTKGFYSINGAVTQQALATTYRGFAFVANDASNFADLATVFDMYRIVALSVRFSPEITEHVDNTAYMPRLYVIIDLDDASTPTSFVQLQSYDSLVIVPPCRSVTRVWAPRLALAAYSGTFTSYANLSAQWIDINSPNVQHYGIKVALEAGVASQTVLQNYLIDVEYMLEFRATR